MPSQQVFLFLQGPVSPFFSELADSLEARGHRALRINLCVGDQFFWRRRGAVNYRGRAEAWPAYIEAFLTREGVTDIVLLGEQRYYQKAAVTAARARGITVTVTDFGYLRPDWITLELDGMSGGSRFPRDAEAIRSLAAQFPPPSLARKYHDSFFYQALWDMIFHLSNSFLWFLFPRYRSYQIYSPLLAYIGTGIRLLRRTPREAAAGRVIEQMHSLTAPYYVLPMQMENDFQLRAYSPYPDMVVPLRDVIASFAASAPADAHLVVKLHPLDPGLRRWHHLIGGIARASGVGDRVHFIDGGSLDALLERTRGVVTVNSTVGVWAIRALRPLKTLGQAIFNIDGLAYQGALDSFWKESTPPEASLVDAFVTALAHTIQLRGVYYARPGLDAAVQASADRLDHSRGQTIALRLTPNSPAPQGVAAPGVFSA